MARYSFPIVAVAVTLVLVTLVEWALGFPPLIFLIAPIALTFICAGPGPGVVALAVAAVAGDYLFVEPVRQFTFHNEGLVLTLFFVWRSFVHVLQRRSARWSRETIVVRGREGGRKRSRRSGKCQAVRERVGWVKGATTVNRRSGERSERTLDAPKRSRRMMCRSEGSALSCWWATQGPLG